MSELKRVLLIDDDLIEELLLKRILEQQGLKDYYELSFAHNISDGLRLMKSQHFHVVLVDFIHKGHEINVTETLTLLELAAQVPKPKIKIYSSCTPSYITEKYPKMNCEVVSKLEPIRQVLSV